MSEKIKIICCGKDCKRKEMLVSIEERSNLIFKKGWRWLIGDRYLCSDCVKADNETE